MTGQFDPQPIPTFDNTPIPLLPESMPPVKNVLQEGFASFFQTGLVWHRPGGRAGWPKIFGQVYPRFISQNDLTRWPNKRGPNKLPGHVRLCRPASLCCHQNGGVCRKADARRLDRSVPVYAAL